MSRLIYYLILVNMIASISSVVPRVLFANNKDGAITSMGLGLVTGLILTYIIIRFCKGFPGKGLPELMKIHTPKWLYLPILFYFGIMWYLAGLSTLIEYSFILLNFLTPEMTIITMILPFLLVISYGILMKSENLLHTLEIVLIIFIPIGIFTFLKAYSSKQLHWDFIKVAIMNANNYPDYSSFTASTFIFMGVINMLIFNRYFLKEQSVGMKQLTIIGLLGAFILFTTYFVPIGLGGFDEIDKLLYPWISTTDSVSMRYGIIDRLVYAFLLFFVSISFISMVIHWHISAQILKSIIKFKKLRWKDKNLTLHLITLVFVLIAITITHIINATELYQYTKYFYNSLPILIVVIFISLIAVNRGAKS